MFTGIIEEVGQVRRINQRSHAIELSIDATRILSDMHVGDSICTDGVCLTVSSFSATTFSADVMPETVSKTTLCKLTSGSHVNLERALAANGRFGGHFVSGHVDGVGKIVALYHDENATWLEISVSSQIHSFIVLNGSIAVDGASLTVADLGKNSFKISLIPHTKLVSTLKEKKIGDLVNIENDMFAKYIQSYVIMALSGKLELSNNLETQGLTEAFLKENGYL